MKFGKEFQQILDDSKFPDEWKSSAIEYRKLKKIIKDVVSELESMGLSPDVLHRLLSTEEDGSSGPVTPVDRSTSPPTSANTSTAVSAAQSNQTTHIHVDHHGDDEVLEFEFDSDEASPPTFGSANGQSSSVIDAGKPAKTNVAALASKAPRDPILDEGDTADDEALGDSALGTSCGSSDGGHLPDRNVRHASFSRPSAFRVRLLSDSRSHSSQSGTASPREEEISSHGRSSTEPGPVRPMRVADALRPFGDGRMEELAGSFGSERQVRPGALGSRERSTSEERGHGHKRTVRRSMNQGGVSAQYVFAGDSSHPEPQLRFHLSARSSPPSSRSHSPSAESGISESPSATDEDDDLEPIRTLPIPAPVPLRGRRAYDGPGWGSVTGSPTTIKAGYKSPFLAAGSMDSPSKSLSLGISSPTIPESPTIQKLNLVKSPIFALASNGPMSPLGLGGAGGGVDSFGELSLGESAVGFENGHEEEKEDSVRGRLELVECPPDCPASPTRTPKASLPPPLAYRLPSSGNLLPQESANPTFSSLTPSSRQSEPSHATSHAAPQHNHHIHRERDIIVPLASDRVFFDLLTAALTSLSAFHAAQQEAFRISVERLCIMISNSIVPSKSSVRVVPVPPTPSSPSPLALPSVSTSSASRGIQRPPPDLLSHRLTKLHKKDLYAWREIFTLWIEAEIFESSAERTRGERTVEAAEERLQKFAHEVVKRGLGDRRTFKGKKVREAWEEFLRLNVLLLDLKRFQLANINAARKILKKHDKRTALTASTGFQSLARATLSKVGADGSVSTWTFYNTSLPHVLLASLTDILLPILPSLDDYACLICTSIAFKPIRLGCQHLFCVRCLVKMQRKGQAECPLCRSPTVLLADKTSLDVQVMDFMRDWFPREVKAKQRENDEEIAEEIRQESGPESADCCIM